MGSSKFDKAAGSMPLPPRRAGSAAPHALVERRAMLFPPGYAAPDGVVQREGVAGGLRYMSFSVENSVGVLLHIHGGGFRLGSPEQFAPFLSTLAARIGITVISPDYPLAPEHPFPAALGSLLSMVRALEMDGPLVIGGDSAGGNLAVELCLLGAPAGALMLISPWLDLRVESAGYGRAASTDRLFSRDMAMEAAAMYLQGHPADDPLVSPVLADLSALPPTFILAGGEEALLDDALAMAAGLAMSQVDVELRVVPDMQHAAPVISGDWQGSANGLSAMVRFLRRHLRPDAR